MQSSFQHTETNVRFALRTKAVTHVLLYNDVTYCEADGRYTRIHLAKGKSIMVAKQLKEFEDKFPKDKFIRVHRSFLINVDHMIGLAFKDKQYIILTSNIRIEVSRGYKKSLKGFLNNLLDII